MAVICTLSSQTGGKDGPLINGCQISTNTGNTNYILTAPSPGSGKLGAQLAQTPGTTLPSLSFTFPSFFFAGFNWQLTVASLTSGGSGTWKNDDPKIQADEEGSWQATAGGGPDPKGASATG